YPALVLLGWRLRLLDRTAWIPLLAVGIYLTFVFALPLDGTLADPVELQHRPFIWPYFLVTAWAGGLAALLVRRIPWGDERLGRWAVAAGAGCLLVVPFLLGYDVQCRHHRSKNLGIAPPVHKGRLECAEFIRTRGHPD